MTSQYAGLKGHCPLVWAQSPNSLYTNTFPENEREVTHANSACASLVMPRCRSWNSLLASTARGCDTGSQPPVEALPGNVKAIFGGKFEYS